MKRTEAPKVRTEVSEERAKGSKGKTESAARQPGVSLTPAEWHLMECLWEQAPHGPGGSGLSESGDGLEQKHHSHHAAAHGGERAGALR